MGRIASTVYATSVGLGTSLGVNGMVYLISVINILNPDLNKVKCGERQLVPAHNTTLYTYYTSYPAAWPCNYLVLEVCVGVLAIVIGIMQAACSLIALGCNSQIVTWIHWVLLHLFVTLMTVFMAVSALVILATTAKGIYTLLSVTSTSAPATSFVPLLPPHINVTQTRPKTIRALVQLFIVWAFADTIFCVIGVILIIWSRKEILNEKPGRLEIKANNLFDKVGAICRKGAFPLEHSMTTDASDKQK